MSIATMNNDQATDAMIRIASALSFICEDKEVTEFLEEISKDESENVMKAIPKYLPKATTLACKRHRDSVYEIVSALSGVPKKEIGNMNFLETVKVIRENWDVLKDFFLLSADATKETANE